MKNFILIIIGLFLSAFSFAQGNTRITINIPQADTTKLEARMYLENPLEGIYKGYYNDTLEIKNGHCQFSFDIKNRSLVTIMINDKFITYPGNNDVLIDPSDNLVFDVPSIKEAGFFGFGIVNVRISGKGSEKVNLTKNMIAKFFEIFKTDPAYGKQSLTYKFETTDRKLNIIDSIYSIDNTVSIEAKDLIKAQLYGSLFVSLYRSAKTSENDSVSFLFHKYIVRKKRMDVFYKKGVINYFGGGTILSYIILSEFKNPVKVGGEGFEKNHKLEYAELLSRRLRLYPEIKDYLLSNLLITSLLRSFDSTTTQLYQYYINNTDFNNPNYTNVVKTYEETEKKYAAGKPFYDFYLPDSTGKNYSLSDFKGKVLVIDFWYNGCGGCKLMVPAIEEIERKVAGENVQFISIGIDKKALWQRGIGKYSSSNSLQLYTNEQGAKHPMIQYLNIDAYPRLIIVDKNGNITSAPADPRLYGDKFISQIRALL